MPKYIYMPIPFLRKVVRVNLPKLLIVYFVLSIVTLFVITGDAYKLIMWVYNKFN